MNTLTYIQLMGIYLSEGYVYVKGNSHKIVIYQKNRDLIMQTILDSTKLNWKRRKECWDVTNNNLGKYLKIFGLAADKHVPEEIKNMPSRYIQEFIYCYTIGDGHIRKRINGSIEHTLFTISRKMADDFQELAQKSGWNSSLRIVKPQKSIILEDGVQRVIKNNGGYCITFKKRAKRAELLNRNFKKQHYNGIVYNPRVAHNHIIHIRRNGKPSWNGCFTP